MAFRSPNVVNERKYKVISKMALKAVLEEDFADGSDIAAFEIFAVGSQHHRKIVIRRRENSMGAPAACLRKPVGFK